jgi:hypothetical protein
MVSIVLLLSALALAGEPATVGPALEPPDESARGTIGLEVLVPRPSTGRLLELPLSLVLDYPLKELGPAELGVRLGLGYAQLSRTEACLSADCLPLLSASIGALVRAGTPRAEPVAGWISLGAGFQGAGNWDLSVVGGYARIDAGLDLGGSEQHRLRLSVGWVEAAFDEARSELSPGHQRYLAFSLSYGPGAAARIPPPPPVTPVK